MSADTDLQNDYVPNFVYEVQFGLVIKMGFTKITNISSDAECETAADGGNNDIMYFLGKPKRKPDSITFSKGLAIGKGADKLSWLAAGLKVNDTIITVRRDKQAKRVFYIEQGILTKVSFSDLDAMNNQFMIKTLEMQHTGIVELMV